MTAFTTASGKGLTLKSVLESRDISKAVFDIRCDSTALFKVFQIKVAGIQDVQLMELAGRSYSKKFRNGLAKCVEKDTALVRTEKRLWQEAKNRGHKLFDPESGGRYAVFEDRPLNEHLAVYCVQDVLHLPKLWSIYNSRLKPAWRTKIA